MPGAATLITMASVLAGGAGTLLGEAHAFVGWPRFRRHATATVYLGLSSFLTLVAAGLVMAGA